MTDETFDRPNRATGPREVWEREIDRKCFAVHPECCGGSELVYRPMRSDSLGCWGYLDSLPTDRYRIRTIPDSPWPPKTRVEKRRVVLAYDPDICNERVFYLRGHENVTARFPIRLDEIRDCEVDESGKVIRVIPFKEGES